MNIPFNREEELKDVGMYRAVPRPYGMKAYPVRKFNTPITPRENFLRVCRKERPLWIPNLNQDFNFIQPEVMPDAYARAHGGIDWFGIDWQYEPLSAAAMVRPGTRRLSDITKWSEELSWPDLDAIDWQKDYDENYAGLMDLDRATMFVIVNGCFERLADLTSFSDALCYLLEEQDAVNELFDALTDFHIKLMKIAKRYYHADVITFHDDMGSQKNAFMSPETFRSVMLPHYKRMNEAAHEMGLYVNFHSCGNVGLQIENFIEAGFDFWEGQTNCNNKEEIMEKYGDRLGIVNILMYPADLSPEAVEAAIRENVHGIGRSGRELLFYVETNPERKPGGAELVYSCGRELFGGS